MAARKRISGHASAPSEAGGMTDAGRVPLGGIPGAVPTTDRPLGRLTWRPPRRTNHYAPDGRCHSGDRCHQVAPEGSRFCATHGAELARIRRAFEAGEGRFKV